MDRSYGRSASLLGVSVGGGNLRRTPGYCFPWRLTDDRRSGSAFARTLSHALIGVHLGEGDTVRIRGQFEANEGGGVVHRTHRDLKERRPGGWILHKGLTYK